MPLTFYLTATTAAGSTHLQLQQGGTPPALATIATGWNVGQVVASNYAAMDSGVERPRSVFAMNVLPSGPPDNALGDCWRTAAPITGTIPVGSWTLTFPVRAVSSGGDGDGRIRLSVWRATSATGASATSLTSFICSIVTNLATSADQNSAVASSVGPFTLTNEYLFFKIAWEITGPGGSNTRDVRFRVGSAASLVLPDIAQLVTLTGIATLEAFGAPTLRGDVLPASVASGEAFGSIKVVPIIRPASIASAGAFGTPQLNQIVAVDGLASLEAIGNLFLTPTGGQQTILVDDFAPDEAFGTPRLNMSVSPASIASAQAMGVPTTTGRNTLALSSVASSSAVGNVAVTMTVRPAAIASAEAVGLPVVTGPGASFVSALGGIASQQAMGVPVLLKQQFLGPVAIASAQAIGSPTVTNFTQQLVMVGVASGQAMGVPSLPVLTVSVGHGEPVVLMRRRAAHGLLRKRAQASLLRRRYAHAIKTRSRVVLTRRRQQVEVQSDG